MAFNRRNLLKPFCCFPERDSSGSENVRKPPKDVSQATRQAALKSLLMLSISPHFMITEQGIVGGGNSPGTSCLNKGELMESRVTELQF